MLSELILRYPVKYLISRMPTASYTDLPKLSLDLGQTMANIYTGNQSKRMLFTPKQLQIPI